MSIGLTTVILFAVFGTDHVYHHAENEQRC